MVWLVWNGLWSGLACLGWDRKVGTTITGHCVLSLVLCFCYYYYYYYDYDYDYDYYYYYHWGIFQVPFGWVLLILIREGFNRLSVVKSCC